MALIESKPENSLGNLHQISLRPSFDACFQQDNIWDVMEQEIHSMDKSTATVRCYHVNMDQNL